VLPDTLVELLSGATVEVGTRLSFIMSAHSGLLKTVHAM